MAADGRDRSVALEQQAGVGMLLFVVIPIAWLSISVLVLGLCRMAARGDTMPARASRTGAGEARPVPSTSASGTPTYGIPAHGLPT